MIGVIQVMKQTSEVERDDNVIKLSFKQQKYDPNVIPHEVAHPASKHFNDDDPLNDLLTEFDDLIDDDDFIDKEEEFIFHHQKPWDYQVQFDDDLRHMADTVMDQIKRLKEDAKRLKYYLDEMNLD